jgi:hypothetical protein
VTPAGHEGTAALQALPNNGANVNTGFETQSPRADYQVEFDRTGLHYVWIRGSGASGKDDSLHVGLDGLAQPDSDRITGFGLSLDWSNATMGNGIAIIDVPSTGLHTINVSHWHRPRGEPAEWHADFGGAEHQPQRRHLYRLGDGDARQQRADRDDLLYHRQ